MFCPPAPPCAVFGKNLDEVSCCPDQFGVVVWPLAIVVANLYFKERCAICVNLYWFKLKKMIHD
jgi:hypothetical protein